MSLPGDVDPTAERMPPRILERGEVPVTEPTLYAYEGCAEFPTA